MADKRQIEVAIVGGGITGVILAIGLLHRNVRSTIYERARAFSEMGAGIGFTENAEKAMKALDPRMHQCFREVATRNNDDWFRYVDGFGTDRHGRSIDGTEEVVCNMYLGERGFEACRRSDFLKLILELLPEGCLKYGKNLLSVRDDPKAEKVLMIFEDGSEEVGDIVIGCDGINSRMRSIMFGPDAPQPGYTHKYAYRGLISTDEVRQLLGDDKASGRFIHMGAGAHVLSCPVAGGKMVNVAAFVTDANPWAGEDGKLTAAGTKAEAVEAFSAFGPSVRGLISLLPEKLDKWAIFDMHDHPLPTFVCGRLCLAGDAAHAAAPHHGAGAGYGVEDCLVLAALLARVGHRPVPMSLETIVPGVLAIYNEIRYDRCQALVQSSRTVAEMYEWQHVDTRRDTQRFNDDFHARCHRIWDYDVDDMVRRSLEALEKMWA
ncbi:putative monooxygenase [Ustulina deusta]|nr:putative monooxygenase [Ustulina deusta]